VTQVLIRWSELLMNWQPGKMRSQSFHSLLVGDKQLFKWRGMSVLLIQRAQREASGLSKRMSGCLGKSGPSPCVRYCIWVEKEGAARHQSCNKNTLSSLPQAMNKLFFAAFLLFLNSLLLILFSSGDPLPIANSSQMTFRQWKSGTRWRLRRAARLRTASSSHPATTLRTGVLLAA
jgi:hypothetical protein